jgi:hypothetical protein
MDLKEVRRELAGLVEDELLNVAAGYSVRESGNTYKNLSGYFQAIGICHLLENAEVELFKDNLERSGCARRAFLRKSREDGNANDRNLGLSRTEAFFASLVAGRLQLAYEIAGLSEEVWEPKSEYEDDYCFFLFVHQLVKNLVGHESHDLSTILGRFEQSLEGQKSWRLEVCKALADVNREAFCDALHGLMEEKQKLADAKRPRMLEPDPSNYTFWPASYISIEGLALLKLADVLGLEIDESFPLCPRIARLPTGSEDYADLFKQIDEIRARFSR